MHQADETEPAVVGANTNKVQLSVKLRVGFFSTGFDVNQEECLAAASPLYWSVQYRNCKLLQMLIVAGKLRWFIFVYQRQRQRRRNCSFITLGHAYTEFGYN